MEWVEWVEDLDLRAFWAQGIVGVGGFIPISIVSSRAAEFLLTAVGGSPAARASSCPCASCLACSAAYS
jgi:hypothetical protein